MNTLSFNKLKKLLSASTLALTVGLTLIGSAGAVGSATTNSSVKGSASTSPTASQQAEIQYIITKGTIEIDRRLTTLNTLDSKISSTSKLTTADKSSLTTEVTNELTNLTTLKTTLASVTTVAAAQLDAQSIISDYRVYLLVVPQVNLVKAADDQQQVEAKLTTLEASLNSRVASANNANLTTELASMTSKTQAAQSLSAGVETGVTSLTPANYDSNHSLLVQYYDDLTNAALDNQAAYTAGKSIVTSFN